MNRFAYFCLSIIEAFLGAMAQDAGHDAYEATFHQPTAPSDNTDDFQQLLDSLKKNQS